MKRIITAESVRQMAHEGKKQIEINYKDSLITPEARVVAQELGVAITEQTAAKDNLNCSIASNAKNTSTQPSAEDLAKIRAAVLAKLPTGAATPEVVDQLVCKMLNESSPAQLSTATDSGQNQDIHAIANGIKRIKGDRVQLSQFSGVNYHQVGLADVVTSADKSSMAAGFMAWKECFFPWTLKYDEVDIVLEGELHIRSAGQTVIAKAGDVIFIPKGSSIEFGTPTTVRFFYVTYPADYMAQ